VGVYGLCHPYNLATYTIFILKRSQNTREQTKGFRVPKRKQEVQNSPKRVPERNQEVQNSPKRVPERNQEVENSP